MKTGNTRLPHLPCLRLHRASMEPGHEDREYMYAGQLAAWHRAVPQWSPAMKTGNTPSTNSTIL